MAKRYKNRRLPQELNDFINLYAIEHNVKASRIFDEMAKDKMKTRLLLDEILGVRR